MPRRKLTLDQAAEIRASDENVRTLAGRFNISVRRVHELRKGPVAELQRAAKMRAWHLANQDRAREQVREWRRNNRGVVLAMKARRRTGLERSFAWDRPAVDAVYALSASAETILCHYCNRPTNPDYRNVDHMTPLNPVHGRWQGLHVSWNLCITCRSCNCQKYDKTEEEFLALKRPVESG